MPKGRKGRKRRKGGKSPKVRQLEDKLARRSKKGRRQNALIKAHLSPGAQLVNAGAGLSAAGATGFMRSRNSDTLLDVALGLGCLALAWVKSSPTATITGVGFLSSRAVEAGAAFESKVAEAAATAATGT